MKKKISILGSTGSIGLTSLNIINKNKKYFEPYLFSANKNYISICKQIKKYKPLYFVICDEKTYKRVLKKFKNSKTKIINNFKFLSFKKKIDITISAIPGIAGLYPTLALLKKSKKILIANKEAIICGWNLIDFYRKKNGTKIIPIDSEHFSVMKLLKDCNIDDIKKIFLTASGGPFLNYKKKQFKNIKPKDALKHPKWKMGNKISVDSATLMNKMLELIEAQKLFNIPENKIDVIIHPNSLVHAIVEFKNGLVKFLYHETSMIIPIANAIHDEKINISRFLRFKEKKTFENLIFKKVNQSIFPIIKYKKKLNELPSTPIIVNASNEILVDQFLKKKIPFLSIIKIILTILKDRNYRKYAIRKPKNINQINEIDHWGRKKTFELIKNYHE